MVERFAVNEDVAGSSPASPANFDAAKVMQALIDYNWAKVQEKIFIKGLSYEQAFEEWRLEILAEDDAPCPK